MKKLKLYKKNKSQKSKLSEIFDVVKNADLRACSLLTLLSFSTKNSVFNGKAGIYTHFLKFSSQDTRQFATRFTTILD